MTSANSGTSNEYRLPHGGATLNKVLWSHLPLVFFHCSEISLSHSSLKIGVNLLSQNKYTHTNTVQFVRSNTAGQRKEYDDDEVRPE